MKKGIMFLVMLLASVGVFAQSYTYNNPEYEAIAREILSQRMIEMLPEGFYFNEEERDGQENFVEREKLFELAKETYNQNPESLVAACNYAKVLLQEGKVGERQIVPSQQAIERAVKVLEAVLQQSGKNTVEAYRLFDKALSYEIFGKNMRVTDQLEYRSSKYPDGYGEHMSLTKQRLNVFKLRERAGDKTLTESDYREAAYMSELLGFHAEADMYWEMSKYVENEEMD